MFPFLALGDGAVFFLELLDDAAGMMLVVRTASCYSFARASLGLPFRGYFGFLRIVSFAERRKKCL
jgi:hypothetical protein